MTYEPPAPRRPVAFTAFEGFLFLALFVAMSLALSLSAVWLAGRVDLAGLRLSDERLFLVLLSQAATYAVTLVLIALWFHLRGLRLAAYVGAEWQGTGRALRVLPGMVAYGAVLLLAVDWLQMTVMKLTGWTPPRQEIVEVLLRERSPVVLGAIAIVAIVLAPMVEEVLFRGLIYQSLSVQLGARWGLLVSSAVFALCHGRAGAFAHIFVLSLVLTFSYNKSQRIVVPILIHLLHNGGMIAVALWQAPLGG